MHASGLQGAGATVIVCLGFACCFGFLRFLALALFVAGLGDQVFALGFVGVLEQLPPIGQGLIGIAHIGAQAQKVKARTKAPLGHETERRGPSALIKARLHGPDFAHVSGQLAPARDIANAPLKHFVDRVLQRRKAVRTVVQALLPASLHVLPEHAGQ